ncbi:hypothetical protein U1Q18_024191 [Sarracenia purpurea var. burkii]
MVNQMRLIREAQGKSPPTVSETWLELHESSWGKLGESNGGKLGESKGEETQGQTKQNIAISGESIQNASNQEAIGGQRTGRYAKSTKGGKSGNLSIQIGGLRAERDVSMIVGSKPRNQSTQNRGQGAGRFAPEIEGGKIGSQSIQITPDDEEEGFSANPSNLGNEFLQQSIRGKISLPKEMESHDALSGEVGLSQSARSSGEKSTCYRHLWKEVASPLSIGASQPKMKGELSRMYP